jgi:hypothetical protein
MVILRIAAADFSVNYRAVSIKASHKIRPVFQPFSQGFLVVTITVDSKKRSEWSGAF